MTSNLIRSAFPSIQFAFLSNRFSNQISKSSPAHDLIIAVQNSEQWHRENFHRNKAHYPIIPRYTFKHRVVTLFSQYGAKIHFNYFKNEEGESVRYGVIDMADLKNDLLHWESLVPSSIMQKPIEILINDGENQVLEWQKVNLKSAFAFSALITPEGSSEKQFFENIAKIPSHQSSVFTLLEKPSEIAEESIDQFRALYENVRTDQFHELVGFDENGKFELLQQRGLVREKMISHLNGNLIQQLRLQSIHSKDEKKRIKMKGFKQQSKEIKVESIYNQQLIKGVSSILKSHKHSRLFQLLMGKMFFIFMMVVKYSVTGVALLVLYLFFTKKDPETPKQAESPILTQTEAEKS